MVGNVPAFLAESHAIKKYVVLMTQTNLTCTMYGHIMTHAQSSQHSIEPHNSILKTILHSTKMKFITLLASLPLVAAFAPNAALSSSRVSTELEVASIQFVKGLDEKVVPDVKLTRAKDGSSGVATFNFNNPNCFDASTASKGEVTGMFLSDDEGELMTTDVNAKFSNGKPQSIEATLVMKSPAEWDRFIRFMENYADVNGLGFNGAK